MSRAEAAAIFARLLAEAKGENISSASARYANFTDTVPGAWYASYVNYLSSYGVVMGNSKTADGGKIKMFREAVKPDE